MKHITSIPKRRKSPNEVFKVKLRGAADLWQWRCRGCGMASGSLYRTRKAAKDAAHSHKYYDVSKFIVNVPDPVTACQIELTSDSGSFVWKVRS